MEYLPEVSDDVRHWSFYDTWGGRYLRNRVGGRKSTGDSRVEGIGWSPASNSEGGRKSSPDRIRGGRSSELRLGRMSCVWRRVCTPLFRVATLRLVFPTAVRFSQRILISYKYITRVEPKF
jgi:hypothetical protein